MIGVAELLVMCRIKSTLARRGRTRFDRSKRISTYLGILNTQLSFLHSTLQANGKSLFIWKRELNCLYLCPKLSVQFFVNAQAHAALVNDQSPNHWHKS